MKLTITVSTSNLTTTPKLLMLILAVTILLPFIIFLYTATAFVAFADLEGARGLQPW